MPLRRKSALSALYKSLGVTVERVVTDNGSCYRSRAFRGARELFGLKHIWTKPYTPKANGKVEGFIQTALREWGYTQACDTSGQRAQELPFGNDRCNWHRPHAGIKGKAPIGRLALAEDNLLRPHIHAPKL